MTPRKPKHLHEQKGRPTDYKPEYILKADEYLSKYKDEVSTIVKSENPFSGATTYERVLKVNLPTIEKFAVYIGHVVSTLYEWDKLYPEFSKALNKIKQEQKNRLLDNGLSGAYNSTIAKLILSANHGMSEKTLTDITSNGETVNFYLPKKDDLETT